MHATSMSITSDMPLKCHTISNQTNLFEIQKNRSSYWWCVHYPHTIIKSLIGKPFVDWIYAGID